MESDKTYEIPEKTPDSLHLKEVDVELQIYRNRMWSVSNDLTKKSSGCMPKRSRKYRNAIGAYVLNWKSLYRWAGVRLLPSLQVEINNKVIL